MEAAAARPQLPALAFPDVKANRDEDTYQSRNTGIAPSVSNKAASLDTSYHHPQGPPPPYSHGPTQAPTATKSGQDQMTPPGSRRASDDRELGAVTAAVAPVKQSLPSISEALGVDNQTPYDKSLASQTAPPLSMPPRTIPPLQTSLHKSAMPTSSPIPAMRAYAAEPPRTYATTGNLSKFPASEPPRPTFTDVRPALHVSTVPPAAPYGQTQTQNAYGHAGTTSPAYEQGQQPSGTSFTYGYAPYPPRYLPAGAGPSSSGPIYQPSSVHPAPSWKNGGLTRSDDRPYGDSVKRHLDMYDLESALNDISSACSFLGDFASRYGNILHQSPRSGPPVSMLPSMIEIEDMIAKSRAQTEAMIKIRETVLTQQAAHDQQALEQRTQPQKTSSSFDMGPLHSGDSDDGKSTFGSDHKKRRGRAAPPGRCHSCNRAETPEWRRGPDGARTLCNACGLHYAKLTRKQNTAGNKPNVANSSNLRPKEHAP